MVDPEIPLSTKEFKKMIMNLKKENLFLIEHINEEEKILERQVKESAKNISEKEKEIELYSENLDRLEA